MVLLTNGITYGQAVAIVLLSIFLIVFIIADIYMVLSLRRKNKKLAKSTDATVENEKTSPIITKENEKGEANE
ncbi:MAG: hypothetical protein K2N23_00350 [Clostridia bacterium]|nr:hypothetical protein [Clostridia bacterium]